MEVTVEYFSVSKGTLSKKNQYFVQQQLTCIQVNSKLFYLIAQHSKFLLRTLYVLYMCTHCDSTNINTMMKCRHTKRLLNAVRRHLSKLRSKRRNA